MTDKEFPRYMMATTAIHKAGDISRDEEDYCYVTTQDDDGYRGSWVEGYGFINVLFPYDTTRECTPEELEYAKNTRIIII